jgi:hypothetical protein
MTAMDYDLPAEKTAADTLAAWHQVDEGLSDDDVSEVEAIVLDRVHFMPERDCAETIRMITS